MTRGLRWLVGIGVLASVITGCGKGSPVAGGAQDSASSSPAAAAVSSDTTTTTAPTTTTTAAPTTTTTPATTTTTTPAPPPPSVTPTPAPSAGPKEWVVEPGESFWSIAVAIADTRAGGQATTKAVDAVWRALVEANRAQLPNPRNPSLLYVGTTLTVPP